MHVQRLGSNRKSDKVHPLSYKKICLGTDKYDFPKPLGLRDKANEPNFDSVDPKRCSSAQDGLVRFKDDKVIFLQMFYVTFSI